jgi:hypothetical protein
MDENNSVNQLVSAIIQRHMKSIHSYEIEITNMTSEILRLNQRISELEDGESAKVVKK